MLQSAPVFALGITLAWLAGIRVYMTTFGLGLAMQFGWFEAPEGLKILSHPLVLSVSGVLGLIEFFADKIPGVDSIWDFLHTLLRIPTGAFLANAAITPSAEGFDWTTGIAGGAMALFSHSLKTGTRAMINHSPEPVSNLATSLGEDVASLSIFGLLLAHPWLALGAAILASVIFVLALIMIWRLIRRLSRKISVN